MQTGGCKCEVCPQARRGVLKVLLIKSSLGKLEGCGRLECEGVPVNLSGSMKIFQYNDRFEKMADLVAKAPARILGVIVVTALIISWLTCEPLFRLTGRIGRRGPVKKPAAKIHARNNGARKIILKTILPLEHPTLSRKLNPA